MKKGFIYIFGNDSMPGLLKIGFSVKVPTERMSELYTTGVPEPFKPLYYCLVDDVQEYERKVHTALDYCRYARNREFFKIDVATAINSIKESCEFEYEWYDDLVSILIKKKLDDINITSRDDNQREIEEMEFFVAIVKKMGLASLVNSVFYDSKSCICSFEFSQSLEEYDSLIFDAAKESISQFEWFGRVFYGMPMEVVESDLLD
jgi:hypothetical protein